MSKINQIFFIFLCPLSIVVRVGNHLKLFYIVYVNYAKVPTYSAPMGIHNPYNFVRNPCYVHSIQTCPFIIQIVPLTIDGESRQCAEIYMRECLNLNCYFRMQRAYTKSQSARLICFFKQWKPKLIVVKAKWYARRWLLTFRELI